MKRITTIQDKEFYHSLNKEDINFLGFERSANEEIDVTFEITKYLHSVNLHANMHTIKELHAVITMSLERKNFETMNKKNLLYE